MEAVEYVSSLCRIGDHAGCDRHPVVTCDCECHALIDLERLAEPVDPADPADSGESADSQPARAGGLAG